MFVHTMPLLLCWEMQAHKFDRQVKVAMAGFQNMVALVQQMCGEFQQSSSVRAVRICERTLEAKVEEVKNSNDKKFDCIRDTAAQQLAEIVARCARCKNADHIPLRLLTRWWQMPIHRVPLWN